MDKDDILSLELIELQDKIIELGESKFRAKQIYEWLHKKRVQHFSDMTNISAQLRDKLDNFFYINSLNITRKLESSIDNTVKYLYKLYDGNHIESVVMKYNHGYSLCISSQVGCKMNCNFCASTIAGFKRNLSPSEYLLQLYTAEKDLNIKISNIVIMGIGEPLDNYSNTVKFLNILSSENGTNMSLRHVSVSTCGLVDKIYELAKLKLGLTLSISLHATNNEARTEIMPVNKTYNIDELIKACRFYIKETGRRISFEYALIEGINDSEENAKELQKLVKGMICHINIIPVNPINERNYSASKKSVLRFVGYLEKLGLNATVRRTLGTDINAACGQLRREYEV